MPPLSFCKILNIKKDGGAMCWLPLVSKNGTKKSREQQGGCSPQKSKEWEKKMGGRNRGLSGNGDGVSTGGCRARGDGLGFQAL